MKKILALAGIFVCTSVFLAADNAKNAADTEKKTDNTEKAAKEERVHFNNNGFSIALLDEESAKTHQVLIMFLPVDDGLAPNVNVQIQSFEESVEEYMEISRKQFEELKLTPVQEKISDKLAIFEYTGEMNGRSLHFYSKAEFVEGKVYLTTATAGESTWKKTGEKLKACVNSCKADKEKPKKSEKADSSADIVASS